MKKLLLLTPAFILLLLPLSSSPASAQFCGPAGSPTSHVSTAIGCLPLNARDLITLLLNWLIGISGGIAIILIGVAGFQIITSRGDPKRVQAGQQLLTAAVTGIAFISLSVVLLNFLGLNVLGLGNLGFNL